MSEQDAVLPDDVADVLASQPVGTECVDDAETSATGRSGPPSDLGDGGDTGRFTYHVALRTWEWDEEVYRIHGYGPGEIQPTTELFLQHKHEEDRQQVEDAFARATDTGDPFSVAYRIRAGEDERQVVVVGEARCDEDGRVTHLVGYYLDLTEEFTAESRAAADAAVAASAAGRQAIEQAKGVLMLGYGLNADAAFAMLRWWSRNRNVKVRDLAERMLEEAVRGNGSQPALRRQLDGLIHDLTADREDPGPTGRAGANDD